MHGLHPLRPNKVFAVKDYDLAATLTSGQAFRWRPCSQGWVGVVGNRWTRLQLEGNRLTAETAEPVPDWAWIADYLQVNLDLERVLQSFPDDEPMRAAVAACRGLRLLRQDPWECLASFILSSTKQIVQIQQIISLLCERFGEAVAVPAGEPAVQAFPSPARLARVTEPELRACKMGFRAPYLLAAAQTVAEGILVLEDLGRLPLETARDRLMRLNGVGRKIADCVLLFGCGFGAAYPVDVWVMRGLRQLYFSRRHVNLRRLNAFAASHFGPHAGYAQQYLFHYMRTKVETV
jgi:N-glycosylase/DNA lyase